MIIEIYPNPDTRMFEADIPAKFSRTGQRIRVCTCTRKSLMDGLRLLLIWAYELKVDGNQLNIVVRARKRGAPTEEE